ncbi:MAG: transporter [Alphaproteobacteria bacterium]|nr:transporter [Alphaproteobacteria bacterium]MDE2163357.1 transporter [Alphaproteobacteria bacterium]
MKQTMLDLMIKMMPLMMPLVYVGGALLVIAVLALALRLTTGKAGGVARMAGWFLAVLGVFFLVCQVAGMWLGATPSINFGDSAKLEFDLKPFWEIGLVMLIPGALIGWLAGHNRHG